MCSTDFDSHVQHAIKPRERVKKRVGLARPGRCPGHCEKSEPGLGDMSKPNALFRYLNLVG